MKSELPIDDHLENISHALRSSSRVIVSAAPGTGKTTRLPPHLLSQFSGKILVLEPRRMSAVAAAHRVAEENSWSLGEQVGYQVRFENRSSPSTRLLFLTEALLARRLLSDPELNGVDVVILDEFHERSSWVDLSLALIKELQILGSPIKLIVMSATLQSREIANYLEPAEVFEVPGQLFELETIHQKNPLILRWGPELQQRLLETVKVALEKSEKDILVFLPGVGEIQRFSQILFQEKERHPSFKKFSIHELHGRLSLEEQRSVLLSSPQRRIILCTNIAESSVTVSGVDAVVDCGLEKVDRWDFRSGYSRLEMQKISLSSARQRAGRGARQKKGFAFPLWSLRDEASMMAEKIPEILRTDLSESLLFLSKQGVTDFENFDWFQKPDSLMIQNSVERLKNLKALDSRCALTADGEKLLRWPLPPELGQILLKFEEQDLLFWGAQLVALLQEGDFLKIRREEHPETKLFDCDLFFRWALLNRQLKASFRGNEISIAARERILKTAQQLQRKSSSHSIPDWRQLKMILLQAWSHRLCRRRKGDRDRALQATGRGVRLLKESMCQDSEFFLALQGKEMMGETETVVSWACGFSREEVFSALGEEIDWQEGIVWNEDKQDFVFQRQRSFRQLPMEEPQISKPLPDQLVQFLPELLFQRWESVLHENSALSGFWGRYLFLRNHAQNAPQEIQEILTEDFEISWKKNSLEVAAYNETSFQSVLKKDLVVHFETSLPSSLRNYLRRELPSQLPLPSGRPISLQYTSDKVVLEVKLQELFGWSEGPRLMNSLVPVTLVLLGPNRRPVQVTQDLASFWRMGYPEVRKELRSRYPKHKWPEKPGSSDDFN